MLAGDVVNVDVGRDAAILIDTVKPRPHGNIKLRSLSFIVELVHGLILLTCAASPRRSKKTYAQARMRYETLRYST